MKMPKIADSDWEHYKPALTQLYINQNKTVAEIQNLMLREHNFTAK